MKIVNACKKRHFNQPKMCARTRLIVKIYNNHLVVNAQLKRSLYCYLLAKVFFEEKGYYTL